MTNTGAVDPVTAAVNAAIGRVGPGLYGVACSGGADSVTLAHAAIACAGAAHVVVISIDHRLRPGSGAVADGVAAWAIGQGAAAVVRGVDVPARASVEAAAREARYAALDAIADELGLSAIFLGHTARDQAETVLMRILRGTGPAGLSGIPAHRDLYLRPLLTLPRSAIDDYVTRHGLPVAADPMNEDLRLARVRMRSQVLPLLRMENPQLDAALVRLAASAAEWLEVIDAAAAPFGRFPIDCAALASHPAAVRKRAVSLALEAIGWDHDAIHLEAIDRLIRQPARGEVGIDVPGGRLVRSYDVLAPDPDSVLVRVHVPVPVLVHVDVHVSRARARVRTRARVRAPGTDGASDGAPGTDGASDGAPGTDGASDGAPGTDGSLSAEHAPDSDGAPGAPASEHAHEALVVPPGYLLRAWEPGDRMRPARLRGRSRKLSDLFIDAKVPRAAREGARVVVREEDGEIVWAEHLGVAFGQPPEVVPKPA